jgi:hypothetical protein
MNRPGFTGGFGLPRNPGAVHRRSSRHGCHGSQPRTRAPRKPADLIGRFAQSSPAQPDPQRAPYLGAARPAAAADAPVQLEEGVDGAAICYGGRGGAQLCFYVRAGTTTPTASSSCLASCASSWAARRRRCCGDGLPAHRSTAMRAWIRTQRSWLVVERLPAYAPELNPVEACGPAEGCRVGEPAHDHPGRGRRRHRTGRPTHLQERQPGFLAHTGLSLDP